jgi:hypothetical protein
VATPSTHGLLVRRSIDVVGVHRIGERVSGSLRLPVSADHPLVGPADRLVDDTLRAITVGLDRTGPRLQSIVVTAGRRLRLLARLESPVGPLLAAGNGDDAVPELLGEINRMHSLVAEPGPAPSGWADHPLVLGPQVAAALLIGARWVLGTPAAARLDGRRVLPALTLLDVPVEHTVGEMDDDGRPVSVIPLARHGRVTRLPAEPTTGLPPGRAVWQHDQGRVVQAASFGLALSGKVVDEVPGSAVELMVCVEGLRRYHPDGQMRMVCLARLGQLGANQLGSGRPSPTFLVAIKARPLSFLRAVTGLFGCSTAAGADHEVHTPAMVLASANELTRSDHVQLTAL